MKDYLEAAESRFIAQKTRDGAEVLASLGMTVLFDGLRPIVC
jgi:hypothetical protein